MVHYELTPDNDGTGSHSQVLYCCSPVDPTHEGMRDLFYSLDGTDKRYQAATWKQVREEDIPTDEIHLL